MADGRNRGFLNRWSERKQRADRAASTHPQDADADRASHDLTTALASGESADPDPNGQGGRQTQYRDPTQGQSPAAQTIPLNDCVVTSPLTAVTDEVNHSETQADELSPSDSTTHSHEPDELVDADRAILTDADMPPIESLTASSDLSGFFNQGVSASLRKAALRHVFRQPAFNVRDGLNDYDGDFTVFEPLGDTVTADMKFHAARKAREAQLAVDDSETAALGEVSDGHEPLVGQEQKPETERHSSSSRDEDQDRGQNEDQGESQDEGRDKRQDETQDDDAVIDAAGGNPSWKRHSAFANDTGVDIDRMVSRELDAEADPSYDQRTQVTDSSDDRPSIEDGHHPTTTAS